MAKPLLAGNWKMHGTATSAAKLASQLADYTGEKPEIMVFPSFVSIPAVVAALSEHSEIAIGAQNISHHTEGAYTGEVSGQMLAGTGCSHVLVGHSERRTYNAENNELVAEKFAAAQASGLTPILCIGETLQQRQDRLQLQVIKAQIAAVIEKVGLQNVCNAIIAYEPVWAVGTGETATPEQAQQVHSFIRAELGEQGEDTQLLYGGSINADNAAALFAQPDIDGGLVGGASLEAEHFMNIAQQLIERK
ncbi:MAG: triose-phosphate isomerase [Porticoccaceae bacterium]|nr:triose-phosphate isomerase [Porticoccaceae bacterium]